MAPLVYGNIIKWFNNRSQGLPGYIIVNMVTQEADLVQLDEGINTPPANISAAICTGSSGSVIPP